ncbi:MAG: hypothetical protein ACYTA5_25450, partial [Planctomycetota bacterium]
MAEDGGPAAHEKPSRARQKALFCIIKAEFLYIFGVLMDKKHLFSRPIRSLPTYQVGPCNPWLINDLRVYQYLYNCRETFTDVMSALQIKLFLQNKPKFRKSQMNVTDLLTKAYEQLDTWSSGKNKPNSNPIQSQTNPIKAQKMQKQTQYKPKTKPIQTQFQCSIMLNCAICRAKTSTGPG